MKELIEAMVDMREDDTMAMTDKLLEDGIDPMSILNAYREAMAEVGRRFEEETYFVPELVLAGEMLKAGSEKIKPYIKKAGDGSEKKHGKVIIATVEGDIHDIGKDIVVLMLDVNGYEVLDLGIDVPVQKVVDATKEFQPAVIGLSGFLTLAYDPMKDTISSVKEEGLTDIKFMIGGGQMDNDVRDYVGADAYGKDAMEAVQLCNGWILGTQ